MSGHVVKICRAKQEDASYIEEKLEKYALDSTNATWQQFFVAKLDAKTVAFARIIDHGEYLELASLGVDYYHRKKGLGTKMLLFLIQEAKRLDSKKPIYGATHKPIFLKNVGFEKVDSYPEYFDYKKNCICKHPSWITILKYRDRSG